MNDNLVKLVVITTCSHGVYVTKVNEGV